MQDITPKLQQGSNQHISKEKFTTKLARFVKITLIVALILAAAGGIIYAKVTKYVTDKEKEILQAQLTAVTEERDTLKPKK